MFIKLGQSCADEVCDQVERCFANAGYKTHCEMVFLPSQTT
jgi:hypothetical protein